MTLYMHPKTLSGFQLSPQQKRLWLLQQDSSAYVTQCAILLEGDLNAEVLKTALQRVINRHGILRTCFRRQPGVKTAVMTVAGSGSPLWQVIDLSDRDEREHAAKIEELFQEARCQGFDFEQGTLLRLSLLKLSKNVHALHICLPALCADTQTIKNLVSEISNSYDDCLKREKSCVQVVQYLQFSEWQNQLLEDEEAELAKEYWRRQKLSTLATLRLPFESKSSNSEGFEPGCFQFVIAPEVITKIETLAQKYETSTAVVLLACWQTLIWRLTGQSDIVIGMASDRREYEEMQDVLGLFATWLPIRCYLTPDLCFTEVLEMAKETISDGEEWQDYFVPEPVEHDKTLAFPIGFEFEQLPEKCIAAGVSFSLYKQESCIEQFKVKLTCTQDNDSLIAAFYYDVNNFCAETIQRLAEQFQVLLASATENADVAISQLEVLSRCDRQRLLIEFNQTQVEYPLDKCIHQLIEEQVAQTPDNIAVVFENQQLTYAQLNDRANQVAHYLRTLGVDSETIVALCVERSPEFLVGLLAILKAGGAYLPIDYLLPIERQIFMLQDAQASVILTQQYLAERLSESAAQVVCLDAHWNAIAQQPKENFPSETTPENLVYVVYTSGSTGKPKGVAIEHRQLLNYLYGILERLNLPVGSSFATVSTFAADLGNTVIFSSLCTGGCLHVIPQEQATDPQALADYCDRHPIDCLKIVPSHLSALLTASYPEKILPRACLILGGETSSWQLVEKLQQYAPSCRIVNHYGPTETTVGVLTYQVEQKKVGDSSETVPLGRPLANTQIYLLDAHKQLVPIGVPGEIHIGGLGLARGYLNQAELTTEKFIPNRFSNSPRERLYKTGDLGRYLPDGNIEFLGRIDHQVKIRGFRIELGEIEAVLGQHPQILQSAVIVREDLPGDQRLVGYLVTKQHPVPDISDLRSFLKEKLPEYMVPSSFVMLDALPLTANGKVDRQALPVAHLAKRDVANTFAPPRTPIEEMLTGIWAEVLGVELVGIYDNFFEHGGHSLLATQLISRVRSTLAVELPLRSLFEAPTVSRLAECVEKALCLDSLMAVPPILPVVRDGKMPLSFAQTRLWFLDQLMSGNPFYNVPGGVRLTGDLNVVALEQSLNEIVRRHESLRTTFTTVAGEPVQFIASPSTLRLPIVDLQHLMEIEREAEVQKLTIEEAQRPFDLTRGPLVRSQLLHLSEREYVLLLTMHHIISDGWSRGILVQELASLYETFCNNLSPTLPRLPIQYADFAVWQQQWLQGEVLESELTYWKQQLANLPILHLPTDRPRPVLHTYQGAKQLLELPKSLTEGLKSLSQQEGVTLFMTLLAAFQTLLCRYTGQEDIVVGSPIANRNRVEIEGLIGFFVNSLVLRTDLSGNPSFRDLLGRVREVALGAYAHQDLPFERLVEELQPERDLSQNPLFQVMFALQNAPMKPFTLSKLMLNLLEFDSGTTRFDLEFYLWEQEESLAGCLIYSTDLFDEATIQKMLVHFQTLLEEIVANPEQRLLALPLLKEAEQQQLLVSLNNFPRKIFNGNEEEILAQLDVLPDEEVNVLLQQILVN